MKTAKRILSSVSALVALTATQGCDVAVGVAAAPFIIGGEAIFDTAFVQASIVQPVAVIDQSGKVLAGPTDANTKPERTMRLAGAVIRCSGTASGPNTFPVSCSNGWRTNVIAKARGAGAYGAVNRVGSKIAFSFDHGGKKGTNCAGKFIEPAEEKGPFQITCSDFRTEWADFNQTQKVAVEVGRRTGVVAISKPASGRAQINIWIGPVS
jgi:hypothetical protein